MHGVHSSARHVGMGVPQGSVIAPNLFSIMLHGINTIDVRGATLLGVGGCFREGGGGTKKITETMMNKTRMTDKINK